MADKAALLAAMKAKDLPALRRALKEKGPINAAAIVQGGRSAWLPGLKALHEQGADLNAAYKNYRALHSVIQEEPHAVGAANDERIAVLEWLLAHGADPELPAAWPSARALVVAAFSGQKAFVDVLKKAGAKIDLFTASALGDAKTALGLLEATPALAEARDHGVLTALQCAAGSRLDAKPALLAIARALIEAGADVNAKAKSWADEVNVAYFAIGSGQIELLELLLENGLEATEAVATAAWRSRGDVLDLLVAHGARLDEARDREKPVLNELVRWGQLAPARLLLARGASPNNPDERGWTAMHQAVSRGNAGILRDLLAAGGDPARRDKAGFTPRDNARAKKRKDLVEILG